MSDRRLPADAHVVRALRVEAHRLVEERDRRGLVVGDDELLLRPSVLEVVVHPEPLHPPADEVEVALAVLADVLLRRVAAGEVEGRRDPVLAEDGAEDVGDRPLREHAAVHRAPEPPERRHHRGAEHRTLVDLVHERQRREDPAPAEGRLPGRALEHERRAAADGAGHVDLEAEPLGQDEEDVEGVGAGQRLAAVEAGDAGGGGDPGRAEGEQVQHRDVSSRHEDTRPRGGAGAESAGARSGRGKGHRARRGRGARRRPPPRRITGRPCRPRASRSDRPRAGRRRRRSRSRACRPS